MHVFCCDYLATNATSESVRMRFPITVLTCCSLALLLICLISYSVVRVPGHMGKPVYGNALRISASQVYPYASFEAEPHAKTEFKYVVRNDSKNDVSNLRMELPCRCQIVSDVVQQLKAFESCEVAFTVQSTNFGTTSVPWRIFSNDRLILAQWLRYVPRPSLPLLCRQFVSANGGHCWARGRIVGRLRGFVSNLSITEYPHGTCCKC